MFSRWGSLPMISMVSTSLAPALARRPSRHVLPPDNERDHTALPGAFRRAVHPATWATVAVVVLFSAVTSWLAIRAHRNFGTWGFDMGIYDQALWLVARGHSFITVRGLPVWGHHVNLVLYLLAPVSWLGGGPSVLVAIQSVSLGVGALPVSWLTRDRFRSPWAGLFGAVVYLLYPPVGWLTWINFHPEALSVSALIFAWWLASRRRWVWFAVAVGLALCTREEVGLQVAIMGAMMLGRWVFGRRAIAGRGRGALRADGVAGACAMVAGAAWFLVCSKLVIPHYLGGGDAFYIRHFYGAYGSTMGEVVTHLVTHPGTVAHLAAQTDRVRFAADLLGPLGGLPILGLPFLVMAGPQSLATLAGSEGFLRDVRFQYTALMIPGLVIGAIEGAVLLVRRRRSLGKLLVVWLAICSLGGALLRGPLPFSPQSDSWVGPTSRVSAMQEAVDSVPSGAGVAATENIIPHLTHRRYAYDFPNPFLPMVYGVDGAAGANPGTVTWLVVDRHGLSPKYTAVLNGLVRSGGRFMVVSERDGVVVARRR